MSKKVRVVLSRLNWDVEYYHDIMSGIGFEISEPAEVDTGEGKIKSFKNIIKDKFMSN